MLEQALVLCELGAETMQRLSLDPRIMICKTVEECLKSYDAKRVVALVVRSGIAVDQDCLDAFPRLRYVIRAGSGLDNIDTQELDRRGIQLFRNSSLSSDSVAELAFAALVLLCRRIPEGHNLLRQAVWGKPSLIGESIAGLTVGVWGGGPVGQACARVLRAFCRHVFFAAWHSVPPAFDQLSPDELAENADAHLLCLPLRRETSGLFGRGLFDKVERKRPYLLNVGRFELMDYEGAVEALANGRLRGLFVDPIERTHLSIVRRSLEAKAGLNLLVSPHLGAQRADVLKEVGNWVVEQLEAVLGPKPTIVNRAG
jgi:D-3-phosphoglycerate dehydrogenase